MTSYNRDGRVGPWAEEKLDCLQKYLHAYTTILRKQSWCSGYFYIDAFAGSGKAELRKAAFANAAERLLFYISAFYTQDEEESSYVEGSPRRALDIECPFTKYFFIEKNPTRASVLDELKTEYRDRRNIEVAVDDASDVLEKIVRDPTINWRSCRALAFLDPFGMQVPWRTLEVVADTGAMEVFLNFPVGMAIQRQLPKSGEFSDEQRETLTRYFGSEEWEDLLYIKAPDLFGDTDISKIERSGERLAQWYRGRLRRLFGHASQPYLIRNSRGSHLYYLMFAGPNPTGARIASDIFLKQGQRISR